MRSPLCTKNTAPIHDEMGNPFWPCGQKIYFQKSRNEEPLVVKKFIFEK